ncbi:hypothetical protein QBC33DRAFT_200833 [Phialemonium atrogriseum]|uniref:Uncharacterized protein n=1 Tax=Phialemonium atrogriseum TaxID=1093897 RepID=A0AAJ0BUI4_9PEZI|nr:uncharacterized protein QBC33DRAFT_200833 [Phialemonium atrogriseum]KAK1764476.1 hypothetical protein QBC33DRAFT_200833 [Phialemonium atrogriseum]
MPSFPAASLRYALRTPAARATIRPSRLPLVLQVRRFAEPRRADGDLGGPGGSETYPASKPMHRKYTTVTVAGIILGVGLFAMMGRRPKENTEKMAK